MAAVKTENVPEEVIAKTVDRILGHASQTGGKFQFSEPWDDSYKYILATPLRSNAAVLSALLGCRGQGLKASATFHLKWSAPLPRPAETATIGKTPENIFCMNAAGGLQSCV